jgi:TorA maturation chaperone TorD
MTNEMEQGIELQSVGDEIAFSELIEVLRQRSATYTLLSRLYRQEIDQELLDEMHGMLYPADTGDSDLDIGYLYIATYLSNLWSGSIKDLKIDFARCFLGHGVDGYSAAYPYESVYTSEKRLLMENARNEVLAIYRTHGIEKTADWKEGEDSLTLELQFERILGDKTIEALEEGDLEKAQALLQTQFDFQKDHLVSWVPLLIRDMKELAQTKLYLGLAYLTEGFLQTDYHFLEDLLSDPEDSLYEVV